LLFAALSFAWGKAQSEPIILILISALGLTAAALVSKSLLGISRQEYRILKDWEKLIPVFEIERYFPDRKRPNYWSPQNALPFLFIVVWLFVLGYWTFNLQESLFHYYPLFFRYSPFVVIVVFTVGFFWREYCLGRRYSTGKKSGSQNESPQEKGNSCAPGPATDQP